MTFCTSVHCMDGRIQDALSAYLRSRSGAKFVDAITEPGPVKILAEGTDAVSIESIKRRIGISLGPHGSRLIAVSGHHDCAGNPEPRERQIEQLRDARQFLESTYPGIEILTLWVDASWEVEEV